MSNSADYIAFEASEDDDNLESNNSVNSNDEDGRPLDAKKPVERKRKRDDSPEKKSNSNTSGPLHFSVDLLSAAAKPVPWTGASKYKFSSDSVLLSELLSREIHDFVEYISPTDEESRMREFAVDRFKEAASDLFPGGELQVFGSFNTKLFLPTSDLDFVVHAPGYQELDALIKFGEFLRSAKVCARSNYTEVVNAKVPIIKCVEPISGYNIDISFNSASGPEAVKIVIGYLNDPLLGPAVRPLMFVLKQYLHQLNLDEPYSGGLGSFGLLLMVVHFLKRHPFLSLTTPVAIDPYHNIGILLMELFEFYGRIFDNDKIALFFDPNTGDAQYMPKSEYFRRYPPIRMRFGKSSPLTIIDPNDVENDVARASYNYHEIKRAFYKAYGMLSYIQANFYARLQDCQQDSGSNVPPVPVSQLGLIITIFPEHLEGRMHVKEAARKLESVDFDVERYRLLPTDLDRSSSGETDDEHIKPTKIFKQETKRKRRKLSKEKIDDKNPDLTFVVAESASEPEP